jgi:hypothetical protein
MRRGKQRLSDLEKLLLQQSSEFLLPREVVTKRLNEIVFDRDIVPGSRLMITFHSQGVLGIRKVTPQSVILGDELVPL